MVVENPLKDCNHVASIEMPDPSEIVNSIKTVCDHGVGDFGLAREIFGGPAQLVHIVRLILEVWANMDSNMDSSHIQGYIINHGEASETHIWRLALGDEPAIGWDNCPTGDEGLVNLKPHSYMTIQDWVFRIASG